jgi:hypothetical protein
MNQDQQPRPWWKDKRLVWALAALALIGLVIISILGYSQRWVRWAWTGVETKSSWDWLELLIVPIVLGGAALWFSTQQNRKAEQERAAREREHDLALASRERENDREIATDRVREEALQRYLDNMQELILDRELKLSEKDAELRAVVRARTFAVVRSLDGIRKGQVLRFLHEAELIGGAVIEESGERRVIEAIIDLRTADLSFAFLHRADLNQANLSLANLSDANLSNANLSLADLSLADLSFAVLSFADLLGANLRGADLSLADLSGADLSAAILSNANLSGAREWTNEQLAQAFSLVGATLPDETVMTEEAWEEFKKRYRQ